MCIRDRLAAYGVTAVLLLILALLLLKLNLSEGIVAIGIMATYLISCFLGGFLLGKGVRKNKFLWGLILGVVYFVLLIILSGIASPGNFGGFGRMISTFPVSYTHLDVYKRQIIYVTVMNVKQI